MLTAGEWAIWGAACMLLAGWAGRCRWRSVRRARLMQAPLPDAWIDILNRRLKVYPLLPEVLRTRLHGYINVFLDEKHFEGCAGQLIDDEVRVTIAAQACLLLVGRKSAVYPRLSTVLVYPHTYLAGGGQGTFGALDQPTSARLGESWQSGVVVLAWDSVRGGAANIHDGHNVTVHEFAHQLDQEDGGADGTPILATPQSYRSWAAHLSDEYAAFRKRLNKGRHTVVDPYGATNPAEFFATASEAFFEKPRQLSLARPDLYEELSGYYGVDPLQWGDTCA